LIIIYRTEACIILFRFIWFPCVDFLIEEGIIDKVACEQIKKEMMKKYEKEDKDESDDVFRNKSIISSSDQHTTKRTSKHVVVDMEAPDQVSDLNTGLEMNNGDDATESDALSQDENNYGSNEEYVNIVDNSKETINNPPPTFFMYLCFSNEKKANKLYQKVKKNQKMILKFYELLDFNYVSFIILIAGMIVVVSYNNKKEKFIGDVVKYIYFFMIEVIIIATCVQLIIYNRIVGGELIPKASKWIHYAPSIIFYLGLIVFLFSNNVTSKGINIPKIMENLVFALSATMCLLVQHLHVIDWYKEKKHMILKKALFLLTCSCVVMIARLFVYETMDDDMSHNLFVSISCPMALDFFIRVVYDLYTMQRSIEYLRIINKEDYVIY